MGDEDEHRRAEQDRTPRPSGVRMPIEDRIPPEDWTAEHPDAGPDQGKEPGGREAERVRSLPWGYR